MNIHDPYVQKVLKTDPHTLKYIDYGNLRRVVGRYSPVGPRLLAILINNFLVSLNQGCVFQSDKGSYNSDSDVSPSLIGIVDKLVDHNRHVQPQRPLEFYSGLDFDIHHTNDPAAQHAGSTLCTRVNAYFHHTQFSRPSLERRVVFHLDHHNLDGTRWSISFPLQVVMRGFPWIKDSYVGYSHGIVPRHGEGLSEVQSNYVGITRRNWLKRMAEHLSELRSGSNKLFHSAWRQYLGDQQAHFVSELICVNHTYDQIMSWEEWAVDREMSQKTSLNMIPGGLKGLKFLHEHRLLNSDRPSVEERDQAIRCYQERHPRLGIPNLLISDLWNNADYAESIICGAEGRLEPEQVRTIRRLHAQGTSVEQILAQVGAKNELQVNRVIQGITYSRIR